MKNETIITAPSIEEAIEKALDQLEVSREDIEVEVIKEPTKRFFGEATDAEVRVSLRNDGETSSADFEDDDEDVEPEGEQSDDEDENEESEESEDDEALNEDQSDFDDGPKRNYNEIPVRLSEDELDIIADAAIEIIYEFLSYFGVTDASVEEYEGDEGELILDIIGDNLAVLIGRHGKTLDSFQFLVSSIVGKKTGYRHPVVVDVEGYKHRRKQKLVGIAKSSAARVIRQKREVNLRPMSPYERRIIHVALKDDKRIVTSSEGTDPDRYVVIKPA
jgi:spoIIIJ-associated protein